MKSWMMSLWLKNHEKIEWPELSISQPEDACHVSIRDEDHFERTIDEMCSRASLQYTVTDTFSGMPQQSEYPTKCTTSWRGRTALRTLPNMDFNTIKYGLRSWRYFAAKKWNELSNDIRIKAGTNKIVNRIRSLNFGD